MSLEIQNLRRVRYAIEESGSYNVNLSGSVTFKDVKVISIETQTNREYVTNDVIQQVKDGDEGGSIPTYDRCNVSVGSYLTSTGVAATGSVTPVTSSHSDLLSTIMGGLYFASSSTTEGTVTSLFTGEDGADKFAGSAVGFVNPDSGFMECVRVRSYDTDTNVLTYECGLPFTPSVGQAIYGSTNIFLAEDPKESLQFYVQGKASYDTFVFRGLQGNFALAMELGQLAQISYALDGVSWDLGDTDTLIESPLVEGAPQVVKNARVIFYSKNTETPSFVCLPASSFSVAPNIAWIDATTPCSDAGIFRKVRNRSFPVATGEITTYLQSTSFFDSWNDETRYGMAIQIGTTPGQTTLVTCPTVQITSVQRTEANELAGVTIAWQALYNKGATTTSGNVDMAKSPLSVHFL